MRRRPRRVALVRAELEGQRLPDAGEMLGPRRADDDRVDERVGQQPRERDGRHRDVPLGGEGGEAGEAGVDAVVVEVAVGARQERHPGAARRGLAAAVLAGQPTAGERAVGLVGDAVLAAERKDVGLVGALEQRARVLEVGRARARVEGRAELLAVEVAEPVRADLAVGLQLLERLDRLVERRLRVVVVGEVEVDLLDAEPLEARLELSEHARAREASILAAVHRVERLRRQARPAARRAQPLADHRLAAAAGVGVRRVEPADPELPARVHQRERVLPRQALVEVLRVRPEAPERAAAEGDPFDHRAILESDAQIQGGRDGARGSPAPVRLCRAGADIDEETMRLHHDKHHQAYVDNANKALDGTEWADRPVESILAQLDLIPEEIRAAVRNNVGGHANHSLFWQIMSPDGGGEPEGDLRRRSTTPSAASTR